jgi:hypothetical protein
MMKETRYLLANQRSTGESTCVLTHQSRNHIPKIESPAQNDAIAPS